MDTLDGVTIQEYAIAIGKKVEPSNIKYISRISQGRVCLYLSSKSVVEILMNTDNKVNIGDKTLEIRTLISRSKRVTISNVCPVIPSSVIISELEKLGIKPTSQIVNIKASISAPGFEHILSFRRQININTDDLAKLPPSLQINYENSTYWIYFTIDGLSCFQCKQEGHLAKFCKNKTNTTTPEVNISTQSADNSSISDLNSMEKEILMETSDNSSNVFKVPAVKRQIDDSSSSITMQKETETDLSQTKKKAKKDEFKPPTIEIITEKLNPVKEHIENNSEACILSFSKLCSFILEKHGESDILRISKNYTSDNIALINMLNEIYDYLTDRNIKSRITRIKKKLANY